MTSGRAQRVPLALYLLAFFLTTVAAAPLNENTEMEVYDGESGCYYNYMHYGEGDRIITNEPCLNCTCHNRMLMCYLRVCPFTKPIGQDCTVEKREDQCCPVITCPDVPVDLEASTTPSSDSSEVGHRDLFGCSIGGRFYTEGAQVPSNPNKPCELCYCIKNRTTCVMQECTLHIEGCTPVYKKGSCCPVRYSCDHPDDESLLLDDVTTTVKPTEGYLLTTTLAPGFTQECTYNNEVYADGALITTAQPCEHCYCMKGEIVCAVQECGTPMENEGKNCTAVAPPEGQCCPDTYQCEGDEATTPHPDKSLETTVKPVDSTEESVSTSSESPTKTDIEDEHSSTVTPTIDSLSSAATEKPAEQDSTPPTASDKTTVNIRLHDEEPLETTPKPSSDEEPSETTPKPSSDEEPSETTPKPSSDEGVVETTPKPSFDEESSETTPKSSSDEEVEGTTPKPFHEESSESTLHPVFDEKPVETTPEHSSDEITTPKHDDEDDKEEQLKTSTIKVEPSEEFTTPSHIVHDEHEPEDDDSNQIPSDDHKIDDSVAPTTPRAEEEKPSEAVTEPTTVTKIRDNKGDDQQPATEIPLISKVPQHRDEAGMEYEPELTTPISHTEKVTEPQTTAAPHYDTSPEKETESDITSPTPSTEESVSEKDTVKPEISSGSEPSTTPVTDKVTETESPVSDVGDRFGEPEKDSELPEVPHTDDEQSSDKPDVSESSTPHDQEKVTQITTEKTEIDSTIKPQPEIVSEPSVSSEESPDSEETDKPEQSSEEDDDEDKPAVIKPSTVPDNEKHETPDSSEEIDKDVSSSTPSISIKETTIDSSTVSDKKQEEDIDHTTSIPKFSESSDVPVSVTSEVPSDITTISPKISEPSSDSSTELPQTVDENITPKVSDSTPESITSIPSFDTTESPKLPEKDDESKGENEVPATTQSDVSDSTTKVPVIKDDIFTGYPDEKPESPADDLTSRVPTDDQDKPTTLQPVSDITTISNKVEDQTTASPVVTEPHIDVQDNEIEQAEPETPEPPRIPGEGDCLVDGITYRNRAQVPPKNKCQLDCYCRDSILMCNRIECSPPPENMINCQPVHHTKDACCPTYVCEHDESQPIETGNQMAGTTAPSFVESTVPVESDQTKPEYDHKVESIPETESSTRQPVVEDEIVTSIYKPDCSESEGCTKPSTGQSIPTDDHSDSTTVKLSSESVTTPSTIHDHTIPEASTTFKDILSTEYPEKDIVETSSHSTQLPEEQQTEQDADKPLPTTESHIPEQQTESSIPITKEPGLDQSTETPIKSTESDATEHTESDVKHHEPDHTTEVQPQEEQTVHPTSIRGDDLPTTQASTVAAISDHLPDHTTISQESDITTTQPKDHEPDHTTEREKPETTESDSKDHEQGHTTEKPTETPNLDTRYQDSDESSEEQTPSSTPAPIVGSESDHTTEGKIKDEQTEIPVSVVQPSESPEVGDHTKDEHSEAPVSEYEPPSTQIPSVGVDQETKPEDDQPEIEKSDAPTETTASQFGEPEKAPTTIAQEIDHTTVSQVTQQPQTIITETKGYEPEVTHVTEMSTSLDDHTVKEQQTVADHEPEEAPTTISPKKDESSTISHEPDYTTEQQTQTSLPKDTTQEPISSTDEGLHTSSPVLDTKFGETSAPDAIQPDTTQTPVKEDTEAPEAPHTESPVKPDVDQTTQKMDDETIHTTEKTAITSAYDKPSDVPSVDDENVTSAPNPVENELEFTPEIEDSKTTPVHEVSETIKPEVVHSTEKPETTTASMDDVNKIGVSVLPTDSVEGLGDDITPTQKPVPSSDCGTLECIAEAEYVPEKSTVSTIPDGDEANEIDSQDVEPTKPSDHVTETVKDTVPVTESKLPAITEPPILTNCVSDNCEVPVIPVETQPESDSDTSTPSEPITPEKDETKVDSTSTVQPEIDQPSTEVSEKLPGHCEGDSCVIDSEEPIAESSTTPKQDHVTSPATETTISPIAETTTETVDKVTSVKDDELSTEKQIEKESTTPSGVQVDDEKVTAMPVTEHSDDTSEKATLVPDSHVFEHETTIAPTVKDTTQPEQPSITTAPTIKDATVPEHPAVSEPSESNEDDGEEEPSKPEINIPFKHDMEITTPPSIIFTPSEQPTTVPESDDSNVSVVDRLPENIPVESQSTTPAVTAADEISSTKSPVSETITTIEPVKVQPTETVIDENISSTVVPQDVQEKLTTLSEVPTTESATKIYESTQPESDSHKDVTSRPTTVIHHEPTEIQHEPTEKQPEVEQEPTEKQPEIEHDSTEKQPEVEHEPTEKQPEVEQEATEKQPEIEHEPTEKQPEVEQEPTEKQPEVEHEPTEKQPEVEQEPTEKQPEIEHEPTEKQPEIEHEPTEKQPEVEQEPTEKQPEVEHEPTERQPDIKTELTEKPVEVEQEPTEKQPEIQHEVTERQPEVEHEPTEKQPEIEQEATEKQPEIEHEPTEKQPEVEQEPTEKHHEVEHEPTEKQPEVEQEPTEKQPEIGHEPTEKQPEVEQEPTEKQPEVEHEPTEKQPEVEQEPTERQPDIKTELTEKPVEVEHEPTEKQPEVEHEPTEKEPEVEQEPTEKQPEIEHEPTEKQPEVEHEPTEKQPEIEHETTERQPDISYDTTIHPLEVTTSAPTKFETTVTPIVHDLTPKPALPSSSPESSIHDRFPEDENLDQPDILPSPDQDEDHQAPQTPDFPSPYGPSATDDQEEYDEEQAFGPGTCRYGGKIYVSAQQIPRDDPCDFCFCFRSDIICLQQSCPPPIQHCHEEPIQGFCCPRYECPVSMATMMNVTTTTTTTTTTLPPHFLSHAYKGAAQKRGCQIQGQAYKVGEVVKSASGPCLHCTCGGDGQMKCDPKVCTPEPMLRQMIAVAATSRRR